MAEPQAPGRAFHYAPLLPIRERADYSVMTMQANHVQVWIEDGNGRLGGAETAQVIRDIYLGNRDPEAYKVCVSEEIRIR